jgi:hypothetical protein
MHIGNIRWPNNDAGAFIGGNLKGRGELGAFLRWSPSPYSRYASGLRSGIYLVKKWPTNVC